MKKLYLAELGQDDRRYQEISRASAWLPWLQAVIPAELDCDVTDRLASNLKHILVGLEMKAALIIPHHQQPTGRPLLFESYAQMLHFEFCVGAFSVAEGIGSAYHLVATNRDGSNGDRVYSRDWRTALVSKFDAEGARDLGLNVDSVKGVRDKLHQDSIGARERVDWHSFTFLNAFCPAYSMLETLLAVEQDLVPRTTNLVWEG